MIKVITIEREYGCGGDEIAQLVASRLNWTLWDQRRQRDAGHRHFRHL